MEEKKAPSLDTSKLQQNISRMEFTAKMDDMRKQMRVLSESIFDMKKMYESALLKIESLERELDVIKRHVKPTKKPDKEIAE